MTLQNQSCQPLQYTVGFEFTGSTDRVCQHPECTVEGASEDQTSFQVQSLNTDWRCPATPLYYSTEVATRESSPTPFFLNKCTYNKII